MNSIATITLNELKKYLHSLTGYVYIVIFLVVSSLVFWQETFLVGQTTMRSFFSIVPWLFALLLPALSMKMWSEEQKEGTIEVILTQPIKISSVILGKWIAGVIFVLIVLLFSLPMPFILGTLGPLDVGQTVGGYLGMLIVGASYVAIGSFASSLTKNQVVAFIITVLIIGILMGIGSDAVATQSNTANDFLRAISITGHYDKFVRGIIDTRDIAYFIGLITIALYWNSLNIRKKLS